ncbi:polysaccharide biosynthesis protein [Bacillus alkalicellulosilyticus]|uniref:polysaccharide biosynthesis protein n=1 Tax=Alkalihalobacterium alkalicellulosilyticum TaxID=1912214 RepID=UPI00099865D0|nr:polysaccharide biosynthesis protein [Bacillus alkalicellulosilyticus]
MNIFLKGAILLIIATFLGECLEFLVNMVLARELGEEGLGIYMSIFPTIILLVVIASLELPISVSKYVAEKEQVYHRSLLKHTIRFAFLFTIVLMALALIIVPMIPVFNNFHPWLRWVVILLIPIVSFSSVAKGYFMGIQHMGKIAFTSFLRKAIQLILLVAVFQFFSFDLETAIFISLCTLIGSELVVLVYLMATYTLQIRTIKSHSTKEISGKTVREKLLEVSIPTTGVRIFHAVTFAIKPFLIKAALLQAGLTEAMAMGQYGKLAGVAFTIGFFPAFIAHSLLIVLIPTVSEAYAKQDIEKLRSLLRKVMAFTFAYGAIAVTIFYVYAEPLTNLFLESPRAIAYLKMLIPYFLFHYFVIPMQAYLIGLGLVKDAFLHSVWATFVSFTLMFVLGSMEMFQMEGIIIGMNVAAVLLTMMHYLTICHKIGTNIFLRPLARIRN